jgi:flagellar biosynthetic protein FliP
VIDRIGIRAVLARLRGKVGFRGGILIILLALCLVAVVSSPAMAPPIPQIVLPKIQIGDQMVKGSKALALPLQILLLMTTLTLAPYILVMTTAFIRITIVLSFLRSAMGTQQVPPTQVLMGMALFMTLYVMMPVGSAMNKTALQPLIKGTITQNEALSKASLPLRDFMLRQTRSKDLKLFVTMAKIQGKVKSKKDVPFYVLLPAFVISEVKTAFEIGFIIYLPFLVIDMVVASVLMSMGMFMLSPMSISLPFKLLLFVMIDGWDLIVLGLIKSFH